MSDEFKAGMWDCDFMMKTLEAASIRSNPAPKHGEVRSGDPCLRKQRNEDQNGHSSMHHGRRGIAQET
jgi:hypothetical protein